MYNWSWPTSPRPNLACAGTSDDPGLGLASVGRAGGVLRRRGCCHGATAGVARRVRRRAGRSPLPPRASADDPTARMAADCLTVLTTIAAHSSRLGVASLVANIGLQHPLPLLRRFASLALIHGGERVYAGLGAGWSKREFEALGLTMPPHRERLARLAETAELARTLFEQAGCGKAARTFQPSTSRSRPNPSPLRASCSGVARPALLELAGTPCRPRRPRTALPPQGGERVPTAAPDDDRRPGRVGALGTRGGPGFDGLPVAHRRRGLQRERQA